MLVELPIEGMAAEVKGEKKAEGNMSRQIEILDQVIADDQN